LLYPDVVLRVAALGWEFGVYRQQDIKLGDDKQSIPA
jgi:hypothetical protein